MVVIYGGFCFLGLVVWWCDVGVRLVCWLFLGWLCLR